MADGLEEYLANVNMNDLYPQFPSFSLFNNAPDHLVFDGQLSEPQNFSLPKPFITYLATASPKIYQKLVKTCKYFYLTELILVIQNLSRYDGYVTFNKPEWKFKVFGGHQYTLGPNFDFNKISPKIWIEKSMDVRDLMISTVLSTSVLPKIFKCNITNLHIMDQEIFFEEFLFLTPDVVDICIGSMSKIKNSDGSVVLVEKLVANLPKLEKLHFEFNPDIPTFSPESLKNLLKLENFIKLRKINFYYAYDIFDIVFFSEFMMEHRDVEYILYYCLSGDEDEYIDKIEAVKEKLATVKFTKLPLIG